MDVKKLKKASDLSKKLVKQFIQTTTSFKKMLI